MQSTQHVYKPIPLRIIFILNAIMGLLPFIFYYVITSKNINIGDIQPIWIIYTGIAYFISFISLVVFILKRNLWAARVVFFINILVAIPAKAYIGIVVAVISILLSFFNKKVTTYFNS
ncbi:hypothetical protein [Tenacibaculum xiamenense]|uniref:hypothetical protein n=1 Tax=Tenacibaculum xiamenense TaxID=1261553 RepID=UPI0038B5E601